MTEHRSLSSRFYRFTMKRWVRYVAVLALVLGWTLMLMASNGATQTDLPVVAGFIGAGILVAFGLIAGTTRWVAEPAVNKAMAVHLSEGAKAHPMLLERTEWHTKHIELLERINKVHEDMIDELRQCVVRERSETRRT